MKNNLLLVLIFVISVTTIGNAQKKLRTTIFQDENSATTEIKSNTAKANMDKAFAAYVENNLEKSKYFIDQSQRQGIKTGDFYFLLGAYMYRTEEIRAAKRYWKIAHKEGGCWECKELLDNIDNQEITIQLISKIVDEYSRN